MLDEPANAAWPPPFTANGHCVRRDSRIKVDTSNVLPGLKTQKGSTATCWADQYAPLKAL